MFFQQRMTNKSCLGYLYGCLSTAEAIAVDVVEGDEQWFIDEANRRLVSIRYVIDTHIHGDHRSGSRNLAKSTGAEFCLHKSATSLVTFAFRPLEDGEALGCGKVVTRILHTPGHTMNSICLEVTDLRRSKTPWFILSGDTLFIGSVGRADLAGEVREMAGIMFDTLKNQFLNREDYIEIWPGHGPETVCGATEISGKTSSAIGFERTNNPLLRIADRDEFIEKVSNSKVYPPQNVEQILRFNRGLES